MLLGPAHNPWLQVEQTTAGIQVGPPLVSAPRVPADWRARWIWLDPQLFPAAQAAPLSWWTADAHQAGQSAAAGLLRGTFFLNHLPARATAGTQLESGFEEVPGRAEGGARCLTLTALSGRSEKTTDAHLQG